MTAMPLRLPIGTFTSPDDLPDKHTNRLAWEECWERDFKRNYSPETLSGVTLTDHYPPSFIDGFEPITSGVILEDLRHCILHVRERIVQNFVTAAGQDNFEEKWRELDPQRRKEIVLEGVYQTCTEPLLEYFRVSCPDSTVEHLSSGDGETFIAMLKLFLPNNPDDDIRDAVHIPHAGFEQLWSPSRTEQDDNGSLIRFTITMKYGRSFFMTKVLLNIMAAFVSDQMLPFVRI